MFVRTVDRPSLPVPDFDPVPVRGRHDGWTPERQLIFIGELCRTRSVTRAARAAGMSRTTAYELRNRRGAKSFRAAWDAAYAIARCPGPASSDLLWHRALYGVATPVVRKGREAGVIVRQDNEALLRLLGRFDRLARNADRRKS
jgi:hypothetical protein